MARLPRQLGDSHNFGRRVMMRGRRVLKPRTIFWEWLMLARDSPLRRLLDDAAEREGLGQAFGFLPSLKFYRGRDDVGGEVERAELKPLRTTSSAKQRELAEIVGRSLALWSWLGAADLHWENLVLGVDAQGKVIFGPLDVEMLLADLTLPTQTKLLPDADPEYAVVCQHAAGVRRVLPYLGKPIRATDLLAMLSAYRATLALLDRQSTALGRVFQSLPGLRDEPLRVLLRGTDEYVRGRSQPLWPPLLDAEQEQLARGDIPYFFRLYGRRGIHYYGDESLEQVKRLPLRGDVPQLDPLLDVRGFRSESRQTLREEGALTLLGAFDHPAFSGKIQDETAELTFGTRSLIAKFSAGEELRSPRGLGRLVSSVYLPCRCGEVKSVLVPERTVCQNAEGDV